MRFHIICVLPSNAKKKFVNNPDGKIVRKEDALAFNLGEARKIIHRRAKRNNAKIQHYALILADDEAPTPPKDEYIFRIIKHGEWAYYREIGMGLSFEVEDAQTYKKCCAETLFSASDLNPDIVSIVSLEIAKEQHDHPPGEDND